MKGSTFSSSGELSESQGLNDFLKAHNAKEELKLLDKASYLQSMNPRHNDLLDYYPPKSSKFQGNPYAFAQNTFGLAENPGFYEYDDENFEEFAGDEEIFEEYDEKDPYDYEVDLNINRKKAKNTKNLDKSYEERKKALQKKRDEKKKLKEEEQKRKEEEQKRREIELAAQLQRKTKKIEEKSALKPENSSENREISQENKRDFNEKLDFDVADALEDSESPEKSVEEYVEPRLEVYDPEEMMKYMGKSGLLSQSQSQRVKTEEDSGKIEEKTNENVYDARQTNQYLRKSQEISQEKAKEIREIKENRKENTEEIKENSEESQGEYGKNQRFPTKLQPTTPEYGLEGIKKCNTDRFEMVNSPYFQANADSFNKTGDFVNENQPKAEKPGDFVQKTNNFNEKTENFNEKPGNFNEKTDNFNEKPGNFNEKPSNFNEKQGNFNEKPSNFTEKSNNFNEKPGNFADNFTVELFQTKELLTKSKENDFLRERVSAYQRELESLIQQLSLNEQKVQELQGELSKLRANSRFSEEKTKILGKVQETRVTNELNEQFLFEKEGFELEIERLRGELALRQGENARKVELLRENKAISLKKQALEEELQKLKAELLSFQEFVKSPAIQRKFAAFSQKSPCFGDFLEEDEEFRREFSLQELLLKGFQKENQRNMDEIRSLKQENAQFIEKLREKDREILRIRARKAAEAKKLLVFEGELEISALKGEYIEDFVVSAQELKEIREKVKQLQEERQQLLRDRAEISEKLRSFEENVKGKAEFEEVVKENVKLKEEIREKNEEIHGKSQEITAKNEEISKKNEEINKKNEEISKKNEEISKKTEEISKKTEEIRRKNKEIQEKVQEIAQKSRELKKTSPISSQIPSKSLKSSKTPPKHAKTITNSSKIVPKVNNFTQETPENPVFFDKFLTFLSSSAIISLNKLYNLLKTQETKRNSFEILKEIATKTSNFPTEFANFQQTLRKIVENGVFQDFDRLSLVQSFENSLFSLILSGNSREIPDFLEISLENRENPEKLRELQQENRDLRENIAKLSTFPQKTQSLFEYPETSASKLSDFAVLERKLEYIEGKYKQKEWEIARILEEMADPLRNYAENSEFRALKAEVRGLRAQLDRERKENDELLRRKNKEIEAFKQELDELLRELERLNGKSH